MTEIVVRSVESPLPTRLPGLDLRQVDEAGDRRRDPRVAEVEAGGVERGPGRVDLGLRRVPARDRVVVVALADGLLLGQRLQPGDFLLGLVEPRLVRGDVRRRLRHLRLVLLRVDRVEEVSRLHEGALLEVDGLEVARDAGPDLHVLRAGGLTDDLQRDRDVPLDGLGDEDLRWRRRRHLLLPAARGGEEGGEGEEGDGEGDRALRSFPSPQFAFAAAAGTGSAGGSSGLFQPPPRAL